MSVFEVIARIWARGRVRSGLLAREKCAGLRLFSDEANRDRTRRLDRRRIPPLLRPLRLVARSFPRGGRGVEKHMRRRKRERRPGLGHEFARRIRSRG